MQRHPLILNLFQHLTNFPSKSFRIVLIINSILLFFSFLNPTDFKWCPVIKDTNFVSRCQEKTFTLIIFFGYSKASNTWLMYRKPVTGSKSWSSIYRSTELDGFEIGEVTEVCNCGQCMSL